MQIGDFELKCIGWSEMEWPYDSKDMYSQQQNLAQYAWLNVFHIVDLSS